MDIIGTFVGVGISVGVNLTRLFINLSSYLYKRTILFSLKTLDSTLNRYSSSSQVLPKCKGSIEYFFIFIDSELIPIDFDFEEEIKYTLELTNIDQQCENNSSVNMEPDLSLRSITIEKIDGVYVTHNPGLFVVIDNRLYINNANFSVFEMDYLVEISVTMEF